MKEKFISKFIFKLTFFYVLDVALYSAMLIRPLKPKYLWLQKNFQNLVNWKEFVMIAIKRVLKKQNVEEEISI